MSSPEKPNKLDDLEEKLVRGRMSGLVRSEGLERSSISEALAAQEKLPGSSRDKANGRALREVRDTLNEEGERKNTPLEIIANGGVAGKSAEFIDPRTTSGTDRVKGIPRGPEFADLRKKVEKPGDVKQIQKKKPWWTGLKFW